MPLHDWTRVPSGLYHDFHQRWSVHVAKLLNRGRLPRGFGAYVEQHSGPVIPDILAVDSWPHRPREAAGGAALAAPVPFVRRTEAHIDAGKANRIAVRHRLGRTVAVIEIVSPGNKDSRLASEDFVAKSREFLDRGVHLLIVDPFPPTPRDPAGLAKAVWQTYADDDFPLPPGKDRTCVSFRTGAVQEVFFDPFGVGDPIPEPPLYLIDELHVRIPLAAAYEEVWGDSTESLRHAVLTGELPVFEDDE